VFKILGLSLIMGLLVCSHSVFGQIPPSGQQRIPQPIIVNDQQAQGVIVVQNGRVQTYTCPSPQQYVTADQSSSGWACYEQSTGVWLLHAQPPSQSVPPPTAYTYQEPLVYASPPSVQVYSYPPPAYYSYGYYPPYPYYYPYYDPFFVGPRFGFGFGFRSPIFVNRPVVISRPIGIRPVVIGRPVAPFAVSRPFGGFRSGRGVVSGHIGRR